MRVDVHNHFYPGNDLEFVESRGVGVRMVVDDQGRRCIEEGVARMANDAYAAAIKERYPRRFRCFASVPLGTGAEVDELDRAIVHLGLDGVVLGTNYMDVYRLVPVVGFPFDTTLAAARLVFSGFLERHPGVRLVVPHAGGALPFLFGRFDAAYDAYGECRQWPQLPSAYLKRVFYDTLVYHPPALRCLAESAGVGQMLFGTDYPHVLGDPERALRAVEAAGFSPADLDAIYHHNVTAGLGIDLP